MMMSGMRMEEETFFPSNFQDLPVCVVVIAVWQVVGSGGGGWLVWG